MKKILSILGTVSLTAATPLAVIACGGGKAKTVKQPTTPKNEKKPNEKTKQTKTLQKATDQQFADEIANIINKKKEIVLSFEEFTNKEKIKNKIRKDFINEKLEIKNFDTNEFDKTKIDIRLSWNTNEIHNTKIVYNNTLSTVIINLKIRW